MALVRSFLILSSPLFCLVRACPPVGHTGDRRGAAASLVEGQYPYPFIVERWKRFPEMVAAWYAERDYNFLALSDHNILKPGNGSG